MARKRRKKRYQGVPRSSFVYPKDRRFPINTRKRAISALGRAKNPRTKGSYQKVRKAVLARYPSLRKRAK